MNNSEITKSKKFSHFIAKIFLLFTIMMAGLYYFQRDMMYFPSNEKYTLEQYSLTDMDVIEVKTKDRQIIQGLYKKSVDNKPTIIFFHGNAGHIGNRSYKVRPYMDAGYGVLLAEYRGYGLNDGRISEENFYKDARAYINEVKNDGEIIIYGESLGSGIATQMATEYEIKALILEVPFDSTLAVAKDRYPFIPFISLIMHDKYMNIDKIKQITVPKLILLASEDNVVPIKFGQRLADAADDNKQVIIFDGLGHSELYKHGAFSKVLSFIKGLYP